MSNWVGPAGEQAAHDYLKEKGYRILERNYRTPLGEIDMIAEQKKTLVFVEVKSREGGEPGEAEEAVTERKQRKLSQLALYYVSENRIQDRPLRFDVVAVYAGEGEPVVNHIENAFDFTETGHP